MAAKLNFIVVIFGFVSIVSGAKLEEESVEYHSPLFQGTAIRYDCNEDGYFPSENGCNKYIWCYRYSPKSNIYIPLEFKCNDGQIWNFERNTCVSGQCTNELQGTRQDNLQTVDVPTVEKTKVQLQVQPVRSGPEVQEDSTNDEMENPVQSSDDSVTGENAGIRQDIKKDHQQIVENTDTREDTAACARNPKGYTNFDDFCNVFTKCANQDVKYMCLEGSAFDVRNQICRNIRFDPTLCHDKKQYRKGDALQQDDPTKTTNLINLERSPIYGSEPLQLIEVSATYPYDSAGTEAWIKPLKKHQKVEPAALNTANVEPLDTTQLQTLLNLLKVDSLYQTEKKPKPQDPLKLNTFSNDKISSVFNSDNDDDSNDKFSVSDASLFNLDTLYPDSPTNVNNLGLIRNYLSSPFFNLPPSYFVNPTQGLGKPLTQNSNPFMRDTKPAVNPFGIYGLNKPSHENQFTNPFLGDTKLYNIQGLFDTNKAVTNPYSIYNYKDNNQFDLMKNTKPNINPFNFYNVKDAPLENTQFQSLFDPKPETNIMQFYDHKDAENTRFDYLKEDSKPEVAPFEFVNIKTTDSSTSDLKNPFHGLFHSNPETEKKIESTKYQFDTQYPFSLTKLTNKEELSKPQSTQSVSSYSPLFNLLGQVQQPQPFAALRDTSPINVGAVPHCREYLGYVICGLLFDQIPPGNKNSQMYNLMNYGSFNQLQPHLSTGLQNYGMYGLAVPSYASAAPVQFIPNEKEVSFSFDDDDEKPEDKTSFNSDQQFPTFSESRTAPPQHYSTYPLEGHAGVKFNPNANYVIHPFADPLTGQMNYFAQEIRK